MDSPIKLIDTHAHVYGNRFDDIDDVLERAASAGVVHTVIPATKPSEFDAIVKTAGAYSDQISFALGIHPHSAAEVTDDEVSAVAKAASEHGAVAIGECGLDYHYDFAPRDRQIAVFRRQLGIARELDLPAVVHSRESDDDMMRLLAEESAGGRLRFQLHCFSSSTQVLEQALDLGGHVSFTGNVTFAKSRLDDVVAAVPDGRFMVETDSPYMSPVPHRGKRNEPERVVDIVRTVAEIRKEPFERIAEMTTETARKFFRLTLSTGLLLFTLSVGLIAQTDPVAPVVEIDTTERVIPYDKLFGVGAHVTSTTFLVDKETSASNAALGFRISSTPLLPLGIDWFGLDITYTPMLVAGSVSDTGFQRIVTEELGEIPDVENTHRTLDIYARFNFKPKAFVDIYALLGYTSYYNLYGEDELIVRQLGITDRIDDFDETIQGIGGGLGLALNVETGFGMIVPRVEIVFSSALGDRPLNRRGEVFQLSQARLSVVYFPPFGNLLGLDYGYGSL